MTAPHPRMHGLTHVPGGADPIPLPALFGAGSYQELILQQPSLVGYWPMDDATGDATDLSGHSYDLAPLGTPAYLQPGKVDGGNSIGFQGADETGGTPTHTSFAGAWGPLNCAAGDITVMYWVQPLAYPALAGGITFFGSGGAPAHFTQLRADGQIFWSVSLTAQLASGATLQPGVWTHVTCVRSADELLIYFDGDAVAAGPTGNIPSTTTPFRLGCGIAAGGGVYYFNGLLDEVAVFNAALDASTIAQIASTEGVAPGDVLTTDGHGGTSWQPPAVEVSGGGLDDTTPDPTPVDSDSGPYAGTPTTGTGWHLEAHTEIVFLVDSTRGRFDVPTMKWTRVPFNTIRILRTWEPTVDSDTLKTAWLPDDRGLSGPAKDGVLHVNADMAWSGDQLLQGWVAIEYPVLDPHGLPDDDPEIPGFGPRPEAPTPGLAAEDSYMRALRPFNLSTGSVLHMPSSGAPAYLSWHFWDEAHVMEEGGYPPPTYPVWPARPLHLPPPYPQLSPTDSRGYYTDSVGDPGWRFDKLSVATTLSAGANLCLQAWQDSPWLIRFSTDRFPAFHGYTGTYRGYPYLYISFAYDPDTIDHTTGKLLLPAP